MTTPNQLIGEFDATIWAREFTKMVLVHPRIPHSEDAMITWFSNAIMNGYDRGRQDEQKRPLADKIREVVFQAAGAATAPLLEDHPDYEFPSERVAANVERVLADFGLEEAEK